MSNSSKFDLQAELAKCKTAEDLTGKNGLVQKLIGSMFEQLLQKEMDEHLGYENTRWDKSLIKLRSFRHMSATYPPHEKGIISGSFKGRVYESKLRCSRVIKEIC
jgi:hypothetical protein